MKSNLKLKALRRLVQSSTDKSSTSIAEVLEQAKSYLESGSDYQALEFNLQIVDILKHRHPIASFDLLSDFIGSISKRKLVFENFEEVVATQLAEYQNAITLTSKALDVLIGLWFDQPQKLLLLLIELENSENSTVREKSRGGLKLLATFNLNAMRHYMNNNLSPYSIQTKIVDVIKENSHLQSSKYFNSLIIIYRAFLENEVQSSSWESYNSLSFSRGEIPVNTDLEDIRNFAIEALISIYGSVSDFKKKKALIDVLSSATIVKKYSSAEFQRIAQKNALSVLSFFQRIIPNENLMIVQQIEHLAYWRFRHSIFEDVKAEALKIEALLKQHEEYEIFKVLIGFEGVFGDWQSLEAKAGEYESTEQYRQIKIQTYAHTIDASNFDVWKKRLIEFCKVESDDLATFPKYYEFLALISKLHPGLMFEFLTRNHEQLTNFLIPIFRGLWSSDMRGSLVEAIRAWANDGRYIYQSMKLFTDNSEWDSKLIGTIFYNARKFKELGAISLTTNVATSNFNSSDESGKRILIRYFLKSVKTLTRFKSAQWIFDIWHLAESQRLISTLSHSSIDLVLNNLVNLKEIDYQAEEILYLISLEHPSKVIDYLCDRIAVRYGDANYDAIPFELFKLNESLSKEPNYLLERMYKIYELDKYKFTFTGSRLFRIIHSEISLEAQESLLKYIDKSVDHMYFVIAILRDYEGQDFTHPIVESIIKKLPLNSDYWSELSIILSSTGVVMGEFGFVEVYKRRREKISEWLQSDNMSIKAFAEWFITRISQSIVIEEQRAEESIILRKHNFEN
ncbi:hypothetical protein INP77_10295 [Methylophilus sp. 13]|uniref:hypothetical protein n=1 Tax=Methylophilus sp. 13 TaxID=2781018 RepID=UPI00188FD180|nr:hypothetical protein [Methylophilus sp. 13]MBF5039880.1 hypothetical protein [Methylophilus sp. 13]